MPMPALLKKWRNQISIEASFVGIKPFSHNIIGLCLQAIAQEFGTVEANKAIRDFRLAALGWKKKEIT